MICIGRIETSTGYSKLIGISTFKTSSYYRHKIVLMEDNCPISRFTLQFAYIYDILSNLIKYLNREYPESDIQIECRIDEIINRLALELL